MIRIQNKTAFLLLAAILALSAYVHLWNPAGFPSLFYDESIYIRNAVLLLDDGILQPHGFYNHPFFGWIVMAGFLEATGYRELIDTLPSADPSSLTAIYSVPRILMGMLAVLDTFLIYKIAERRFGWRTGMVASALFAVMPMSWFLRMVLLDSILLPMVLSSILLALCARDSGRPTILVAMSGVCLGLAILTKIPAFAVIPLVLFLVYGVRKKLGHVILWFVPVLAIPMIWPAYAMSVGQLDHWIRGIIWQTGRSNGGLHAAMWDVFRNDPVLICIGMAGIALAAACLVWRRAWKGAAAGKSGATEKSRCMSGLAACLEGRSDSLFVVLWFAPPVLFFAAIGYVVAFHIGNLLPVLCIAAAILLMKTERAAKRLTRHATQNRMMAGIVLVVVGFGLYTTGTAINTNASHVQFEMLSYVLENVDDKDVTIIANNIHAWILSYIYGYDNAVSHYSASYKTEIDKVVIMIDYDFAADMDNARRNLAMNPTDPVGVQMSAEDQRRWQWLIELHDETHVLAKFGGSAHRPIEIRTNDANLQG